MRLTLLILLSAITTFGQTRSLRSFCDSLVLKGIEQKLVPGLGLVVMQGDTTLVATYGLANVEDKVVTDTTTLFQLGSVGKLFTAIAVLQQVESGKLDLHADVNQYLHGFSMNAPGRPITLFDLLTHTAGLDDRIIGYLAHSTKDVKSLEEHLKQVMPPSFQAPGIEINYSNYGYALAGHLVERVTGLTFTQYVKDSIFLPLGMSHTTYDLPDNYETLPSYAHGYRIRDDYEKVTCYPRHATPAGSALSCVADMKKFLAEMLRPSGKILSQASMSKLVEQQFTNDTLLMGYTIGMEVQHINGYHGVAKGGAFTGFLSELVLFPEESIGIFVTTNTQTDNFLESFSEALFARLLPRQPGQEVPAPPLDLKAFAGVYRSERYNHRTVEDLLALYQGKLELSVSETGTLTTYQNGDIQHYKPTGPLTFSNTRVPEQCLVFKRNEKGELSRLYTNINLAGFYIPVSLSPVAWYDDPEMINEYYFVVVLIILTFILVPVFRAWVLLRRRSNPGYWSTGLISTFPFYTALVIAALFLLQFIGGFMYLARHINDFFFAVPDSWRQVQITTYVLPFAVLLLVLAAIQLWLRHDGRLVFRVYYSLVALCAVIHLAFLYRWHFIGIHV